MHPSTERSEDPRVSIIILAHNNPQLLKGCLLALAEDASMVTREIIILLNGATQDVCGLQPPPLLRYTILRSDLNLGFAGGCNYAARCARGEFLVLLNDDTEVEASWLDALVALADEHPDAGAIGSRILFPNGQLQEAGSIIWNDGSTMPIGRGAEPDESRFKVVRDVDFVSGCALLVRHSTWQAIGGLCEDYHPAYYEDVDLCMSIREQGQRVLYAPGSSVRHHQSASTSNGFRTFLIKRNQALFATKWAASLGNFEAADPESPLAIELADLRARRCHHRVLIVDDRLPDPALGSGFGRLDEAAGRLADAGYLVDLYPVDRRMASADRFRRRGVDVIAADLESHLCQPHVIYDAVLVSRPHNFERFARTIRLRQPQAALLYDAEALFHVRLERQIAFAPVAQRASIGREASIMRSLEDGIRSAVDSVLCVSPDEARHFQACEGAAPVVVMPPLVAAAVWTGDSFSRRSGAVFVAGWLAGEDSPNVDGLCWFASEVLPIIVDAVPTFELVVTGANPPMSVCRLASDRVRVVGHVDTLHDLYNRVRVALVPIRFGSGVKIKTLEALQYGVPFVATRVGAEGLDLGGSPAGRVSDTAAGFAAATVALLSDSAAWLAARDSIQPALRAVTQGASAAWPQVIETALLARSPLDVARRLDRLAQVTDKELAPVRHLL